jgi:hypothetical protein
VSHCHGTRAKDHDIYLSFFGKVDGVVRVRYCTKLIRSWAILLCFVVFFGIDDYDTTSMAL